jgi:hypothetical protein
MSEFIRIKPGYVAGLLLVSGLCLGFAGNWVSLEHQAGDVQVTQVHDYFYSTSSYL